MKIVLSDKRLDTEKFPADVKVEYITYKTLDKYNQNPDVIAIVGSRAMAIKAAKMDLRGLKLFQLTSAGFDGVPYKIYAGYRNKGQIPPFRYRYPGKKSDHQGSPSGCI